MAEDSPLNARQRDDLHVIAGVIVPASAEFDVPGADDPSWEEVPLHLRQQLRGPAHQLVTPVQGALKKPGSRRLLSAVRAAAIPNSDRKPKALTVAGRLVE